MYVYAFYDNSLSAHPEQAEFIRLWALSWGRRGFETKLLTARQAQRSTYYPLFLKRAGEVHSFLSDCRCLQWLAMHAVRGSGWLVSPQVINFSLPPKRQNPTDVHIFSPDVFRASRAGVAHFVRDILTPPWLSFVSAKGEFPVEHLKHFSRAADVLTCGRPL